MLKKEITYTNYDGVKRTKTFYFNLNKAELTKLENSINGGLSAKMQKLVENNDTATIMELFDQIVLASYGEKSSDGEYFIKSKELTTAFTQTDAYSELFMELANSEKAFATFIEGVIPQGLLPNK